jgi:3-hydroxyisobutyrate dehydrogenase-like beta-hydroxyacid dehydrogenase
VNADVRSWHIGLVGYGEVGRIFAEDLRRAGRPVLAYDRLLGAPGGADAALRAHAQRHGVVLAASHADLAAGADLVVSAVTASQAVAVAQACAPGLRAGSAFLDVNSASPGAKRRAARWVESGGGRYVEAAVMTSVPPYRIAVPMLLGGPHAQALQASLALLGFAARVDSPELGRASATKMCRSVIIKGMEAMFIESLVAARAYGVEDQVLASLAETFPGIDWERQASYFFRRVIEHGRRRSEEMVEAAATVHEMGLEPWSADATARRQAWVAALAAEGRVGSTGAAGGWREPADRLLETLKGRAGAAVEHPAS